MSEETTDDLMAKIVQGFDPGSFVTKFVLVAEVIDTNGKRGVWAQAQSDMTRWDTYGLLTEAMEQEKIDHFKASTETDI